MSRGSLGATTMQRLFETGSLSGLSEWQLLDRFARVGDQVAFEVLVSRHGPMVLGVCRRILREPCDVDDAFQATFLVLIRRAGSLGPRDVLAAWLHGVALKVATRSRADRARRAQREREATSLETPAPDRPQVDFELREVIDQEIERLPWKYRAPVALCYFEGLTHEEAARRLDWPLGTVKGRLARARSLLGARLSRRGISAGAGAVAGALGIQTVGRAAVAEPLLAATLRTSARIAEGVAWKSAVSGSVANLVQGVVAAMLLSKYKIVGALLLVSATAMAGAGIAGGSGAGAGVEATEPGPVEARPPVVAAATPPIGALSPITPAEQFEGSLIEAARRAFLAASEGYRQGTTSLDRVVRMSRLLFDAQTAAAANDDDRIAAASEHLDRLRSEMRRGVPDRTSPDAESETAEARALLAEAEAGLARARAAKKPRGGGSSTAKDETDADPRTTAILKRLAEPLAMNFPNDTPLEDILKYIRQSTKGPGDNGIPIYLDPLGLNEAGATETSPVTIDMDGQPLRVTLQLVLRQLGLKYFVNDGFLCITSIYPPESKAISPMREPPPLSDLREKALRGELGVEEMKELLEKLKLMKELEAMEDAQPFAPARLGEEPKAAAPMTSEQAEALLRQMKDLTETLRSARERPQSRPRPR